MMEESELEQLRDEIARLNRMVKYLGDCLMHLEIVGMVKFTQEEYEDAERAVK